MITAEEARLQLNSLINESAAAELNQIEEKIHKAIAKNHDILYVTGLSDTGKLKLEMLGYTVTSTDDPRDYPAGGYAIKF